MTDAHLHGQERTTRPRYKPADMATCAHQQLELLKNTRDALSLFTIARTLGVHYKTAARAFLWLQTLGHVETAQPPRHAPLRPRRLYYRLSPATRRKPPSEYVLRIQIRAATWSKN